MDGSRRIVILSDTHLGKPRGGARSAKALFPLIDGADRLILNGDTAELHHPRFRAAAAREVITLRDHCESQGTELTLIAGNHDPLISSLRTLRLFDGQIMVTHGDVLHPAIAPWAREAGELREMHAAALHAARSDASGWANDEELQQEAARHASHRYWSETPQMPEGLPLTPKGLWQLSEISAKAMYYWMTLPNAAFSYCAFHAPRSRYFVFGHIHRPGVWQRDGRVVINTGAFERPSRPRGVVIENGLLRVLAIRDNGGAWAWGDRVLFEDPLDADASSLARAA